MDVLDRSGNIRGECTAESRDQIDAFADLAEWGSDDVDALLETALRAADALTQTVTRHEHACAPVVDVAGWVFSRDVYVPTPLRMLPSHEIEEGWIDAMLPDWGARGMDGGLASAEEEEEDDGLTAALLQPPREGPPAPQADAATAAAHGDALGRRTTNNTARGADAAFIATLRVPDDDEHHWARLLRVLMWCIKNRAHFRTERDATAAASATSRPTGDAVNLMPPEATKPTAGKAKPTEQTTTGAPALLVLPKLLPYVFYAVWRGGRLPPGIVPSVFFTMCYDVVQECEGLWDHGSSTAALFDLSGFDSTTWGGTCVDLRAEHGRKGVLAAAVLGITVAAGMVVEREAQSKSVGGTTTAGTTNSSDATPPLGPSGRTADALGGRAPPHAAGANAAILSFIVPGQTVPEGTRESDPRVLGFHAAPPSTAAAAAALRRESFLGGGFSGNGRQAGDDDGGSPRGHLRKASTANGLAAAYTEGVMPSNAAAGGGGTGSACGSTASQRKAAGGKKKRRGTAALLKSGLVAQLIGCVSRCKWVGHGASTPLLSHSLIVSCWVLELLTMVREEYVLMKGGVFIFNLFEGCVTRIRAMRTRIVAVPGGGVADVAGADPYDCLQSLKRHSRPHTTFDPIHATAAASRPVPDPDAEYASSDRPLFPSTSAAVDDGDDDTPARAPAAHAPSPGGDVLGGGAKRRDTERAIDDYLVVRATLEREEMDRLAHGDDAGGAAQSDSAVSDGPRIFKRDMLVAHTARAEGVYLSHRGNSQVAEFLRTIQSHDAELARTGEMRAHELNRTGAPFVDEAWESIDAYLMGESTTLSYMYRSAHRCLEMMTRMGEQVVQLHGTFYVPLKLLVGELLRVRLRSVRHLIDYLMVTLSGFQPYDPALRASEPPPPPDLLQLFEDFNASERAVLADLHFCIEKQHHAMAAAVWGVGHRIWGWGTDVMDDHSAYIAHLIGRMQMLSGVVLAGCAQYAPEVFAPPAGRTKVGGVEYPIVPLNNGFLHIAAGTSDTVTLLGALAGYVEARTGRHHLPHRMHLPGAAPPDVAVHGRIAGALIAAAHDPSSIRFVSLAAAVAYTDDKHIIDAVGSHGHRPAARGVPQTVASLFKPLVAHFNKLQRRAPPGSAKHAPLFPSAFVPGDVLFKEPVAGMLAALREGLRKATPPPFSAVPLKDLDIVCAAPAAAGRVMHGDAAGGARQQTQATVIAADAADAAGNDDDVSAFAGLPAVVGHPSGASLQSVDSAAVVGVGGAGAMPASSSSSLPQTTGVQRAAAEHSSVVGSMKSWMKGLGRIVSGGGVYATEPTQQPNPQTEARGAASSFLGTPTTTPSEPPSAVRRPHHAHGTSPAVPGSGADPLAAYMFPSTASTASAAGAAARLGGGDAERSRGSVSAVVPRTPARQVVAYDNDCADACGGAGDGVKLNGQRAPAAAWGMRQHMFSPSGMGTPSNANPDPVVADRAPIASGWRDDVVLGQGAGSTVRTSGGAPANPLDQLWMDTAWDASASATPASQGLDTPAHQQQRTAPSRSPTHSFL